MAFDITDAGRVGLGTAMGPEIAQVAGTLVSRDSEEYVLAVSDVFFLRGGDATWRGEEVHIKESFVSTVYLRQFSPAKTIGAVAVGVGAVALFAGKALANSFTNPPPIDTTRSASSRGRRPVRRFHAPLLRRPNPPRSY